MAMCVCVQNRDVNQFSAKNYIFVKKVVNNLRVFLINPINVIGN